MPKIEQHDLREYYVTTVALNVGAGVETWYFVVPRSGYLVRAIYTANVAQTVGDALLTFAIGTVDLSPTLTIPSSGGVAGRSHVVEFARASGSLAYEPEDADLIAAGGVVAVDTDGGGAGGGRLVLVIQP